MKTNNNKLVYFLIVLVVVLLLIIAGGLYYFLVIDNESKEIQDETNKLIQNDNEEEKVNYANEKEDINTNTEDKENTKKSVFDVDSTLEYHKDWKNDENGKIAILKMGEKIFKTEIADTYYTYVDNFSNSHKIKKITNIKSKFFMMGIDDWAALYKCTIEYNDNNNEKQELDIAVIIPTDDQEAYIMAPFDNYTGSTSFVRGFAEITEQ